MVLSCLLETTPYPAGSRKTKNSRKSYNISFIEQVCSVKMAGILASAINVQKNIQPS